MDVNTTVIITDRYGNPLVINNSDIEYGASIEGGTDEATASMTMVDDSGKDFGKLDFHVHVYYVDADDNVGARWSAFVYYKGVDVYP